MTSPDPSDNHTPLADLLQASDRGHTEPDRDRLAELRRQTLAAFQASPAPTQPRRNPIMSFLRNHRALASAAGLILVASVALVVFHTNSASVAWADVRQSIQGMRTATFTLQVRHGGHMDYTAKVYYKAPGLMRMEREGVTTVFDWTQGKVLGMMHEERFAFISVVADTGNPFHKDWLSELQQTVADEEAQAMGTRRIDGRELAGWRIQLPPDESGGMDTLTVWADAHTGQMVQAEFAGPTESMTFSDFRIGAEIDDEKVSLTPPEGYTVQETKFSAAEPSLNDVARLLRFWSTAYGGKFPPSLASHKFPIDARKIDWQSQISSEEQAQAARMAISRSFWLLNSRGDWRYPGAGKATGSADQVVFWMPDDEGPGRVQAIFGDFSVRAIPESDLPAQQD